MKVLIAAAIFGISCGIYGCSSEAKFAGRPMAATEAPASSPGVAIQTAADAVAEVKTPAVVVNPPAVVLSRWVDVTTTNGTTPSTCDATTANCTMQDPINRLKWSNRRPDAIWQVAIDHCNTLTYNGVGGWRLPTKDELRVALSNGIYSEARTNWITQADMNRVFWSAYSPRTSFAWGVYVATGNETDYLKTNDYYAVVCVHSAVVNPPAVAPAGWVDVTTVGPNLTLKDTRTGLQWSNKRPNATWQGAIDHCHTLNYNGVTGWRLPTKDEFSVALSNGIYSAARTNWMTLADMRDWFWSASSRSYYTEYAWLVHLGYGNSDYDSKYNYHAFVCVQ